MQIEKTKRYEKLSFLGEGQVNKKQTRASFIDGNPALDWCESKATVNKLLYATRRCSFITNIRNSATRLFTIFDVGVM